MLARVLAAMMLLASIEAMSQTSEDYALMGATAWAAFQCSTLVDKRERANERQQLFNLGYEKGITFIEAWQSGKVEWEHVYRRVPIDLLDRLEPWVSPALPTVEFRLGAIWGSATRSMLDLMEKSAVGPKHFAAVEFNRRNCSSLLAMGRRQQR